ncbi:MAG: hypothetical protein LPK45_00950 [Bacteroidota bacterium]|nr:hypothetical protein [Bacteroidota bacterium]MDX5429595.1 hypothetical protein [Bacteroidota bacterium]MDX5468379.1 hypothetical protein [Bacteroidota bacterium]
MISKLGKGLLFGLIFAALSACDSEEEGPKEFYGEITYKVTVGGAVGTEMIEELQALFGDSIKVAFTDKGYRLQVFKEVPVTEWYENDKGTIYYRYADQDTLYFEPASESNMLLSSEKRSEMHTYMGRSCKTYFLQDQQFHIEMWYDSTLYVSPKRFSRLYQGHYNRYYMDCKAPYLVRSLVMPPVNIRIEAQSIHQQEQPDPAWSERPELTLVEASKDQ